MFNLYRRKDKGRPNPIYWVNLRFNLPNGTTHRERVSSKCTDRRAAEEWARLYEAERFAALVRGARDTTTPPEKRTLADAFELMAEHTASRVALHGKRGGMSPATASFYALHLGHFARVWGLDTPLAEITTGKARTYVQTRLTEPGNRAGETVSLHTITKELGALRIVLKLAAEQGWYPHDPRAIVPTGVSAEYTPGDRTLTPKELDKLKKHLDPARWAVVAFACATGAEASALPRALRSDIHLTQNYVIVRGSKNEKREGRTVPVVLPVARRLLREVLDATQDAAPAATSLLFPRLHTQNLRRAVILASQRAKIAPSSPNDWRRTFATWHADAGISLDTLRHAMGHASSKMLQRVYDKPQDIGARMRREMKGQR